MADAAQAGMRLPLRPGALRLLSWALGALLLAAAAALAWRTLAAPAPYRYELQATPVGAADGIQTVRVLDGDGALLAEAEVARDAHGPLLLQWHARVDDPLLYLNVPGAETQALAQVLARHRQPGMAVLAWWDTSRQLRHWGAGEMRFDQHLARPLFVPQRWHGQQRQVLRAERDFWGTADAAQLEAFDTFARALVATEEEGVKLLRALAPAGAIVVLHLRDLVLLGELFPQQLGVSFQDFADTGDVHRSVRGVQGWLREGTQQAYSVMKLPDNRVRAIALNDEASAATLAARLLPLIGNRQDDVAGLTMVYRAGGYAVFELAAAAPQ
jgi:hydroxylamine oxidation protein HaoB